MAVHRASSPRAVLGWLAIVGVLALGGLAAGCLASEDQETGTTAESVPEAVEIASDDLHPPLTVFAAATFYTERPEPEEVLIGVLKAAEVREKPDTRDMPFRLVVGESDLAVYVAGFDHEVLRPFVDRRVRVVGKRIDQSAEGYGAEIWIARLEPMPR
jgi:hypothetical protein